MTSVVLFQLFSLAIQFTPDAQMLTSPWSCIPQTTSVPPLGSVYLMPSRFTLESYKNGETRQAACPSSGPMRHEKWKIWTPVLLTLSHYHGKTVKCAMYGSCGPTFLVELNQLSNQATAKHKLLAEVSVLF